MPLTAQRATFGADERDFYRSFQAQRGCVYPPNAAGYNARRHADPFLPRPGWGGARAVTLALLVAVLAWAAARAL